jgi:hypothetical protein
MILETKKTTIYKITKKQGTVLTIESMQKPRRKDRYAPLNILSRNPAKMVKMSDSSRLIFPMKSRSKKVI